jgi:diphthine-ammonia ligase
VENVCLRLNLQPLTFLWQYDRRNLFYELVQSDMEIILVKVAGAGLDPNKHLGKTKNYH